MTRRAQSSRSLFAVTTAMIAAAVLGFAAGVAPAYAEASGTASRANAETVAVQRAFLVEAQALAEGAFGDRLGVARSEDLKALQALVGEGSDIADIEMLERGDQAAVLWAFETGRIDSFYAPAETVRAMAKATEGRYVAFTPPAADPAQDYAALSEASARR